MKAPEKFLLADGNGKGGSEGYSTMLTALATHGESRTAQENAQKILDAQGAVNAAAMSAKDALMAAQQALTNAMALPAGTAGRMEAVEELEAVIKELEMEITIKDDGMHMLVAGGDLDTHTKVEEDVNGDGAGQVQPRRRQGHGDAGGFRCGGGRRDPGTACAAGYG